LYITYLQMYVKINIEGRSWEEYLICLECAQVIKSLVCKTNKKNYCYFVVVNTALYIPGVYINML